MVDSGRLEAVSEELRTSIPADMQEAREILNQKEAIINQAHLEARRVKESAEREAMTMTASAREEAMTMTASAREEQATKIDDAEIVKEAHAKADEINQRALQEAQEITQDAQRQAYQLADEAEAAMAARREGANQYARETLYDLEERLSGQLGEVRRGIDALGLGADIRVPS